MEVNINIASCELTRDSNLVQHKLTARYSRCSLCSVLFNVSNCVINHKRNVVKLSVSVMDGAACFRFRTQ